MKKFLVLAGILASLLVPLANATVEVRIINVVGGVAVGDTGWITCAGAFCSTTGVVGNWEVTSDITVQHTASNPLLDMAYSASTITNSNPGTIILEAMADGYTVGTPGFQFVDNGNSGFSGTVTDAAYGGNNNNICLAGASACWNGVSNPAPSGTSSALIATSSTSSGSWSVNMSGPGGTTANPYSLGLVETLTNPTGLSSFSGDAKINAVPEPTTIVFFGSVILTTVGFLRRKAQRLD